jgi:hypothetical protein
LSCWGIGKSIISEFAPRMTFENIYVNYLIHELEIT